MVWVLAIVKLAAGQNSLERKDCSKPGKLAYLTGYYYYCELGELEEALWQRRRAANRSLREAGASRAAPPTPRPDKELEIH